MIERKKIFLTTNRLW